MNGREIGDILKLEKREREREREKERERTLTERKKHRHYNIIQESYTIYIYRERENTRRLEAKTLGMDLVAGNMYSHVAAASERTVYTSALAHVV